MSLKVLLNKALRCLPELKVTDTSNITCDYLICVNQSLKKNPNAVFLKCKQHACFDFLAVV